jgi:AraC family transcriptional regulator
MADHVLVTHLCGSGDVWVKIVGKRERALAMPGTITLIPRGHDSERVVTASLEFAHVYLSHDRLLLCTEEIGNGRTPELIDRQFFSDARLFSIARLLLQEVEARESASKLFVEQMTTCATTSTRTSACRNWRIS